MKKLYLILMLIICSNVVYADIDAEEQAHQNVPSSTTCSTSCATTQYGQQCSTVCN